MVPPLAGYNEAQSSGYNEYNWCGERLFALTGLPQRGDNSVPMRVKFALLGDYAVIAKDEKLSILGMFDEINPPVLPFQAPSIFLTIGFEGESTESNRDFELVIELWAEDGERLLSHPRTFQFPEPRRPGGVSGHNEVLALYGFPFQTAGDYAFRIVVSGEERARVPLRVNAPKGGSQ